ncbi:hypothetical protein IFO69_11920 [Echinicola sp. CAU 1574]|uniref:Secreted protein n=1 Tax=Echinicola arenosa TaxID=2774144 RepID=A0ABR9AM65_9BACT|nr:hypothetical protein [Echinicola arenosa]MBD8489452.1 hypothetical protein [Echinicola arenosa]
MKKLTLILFVLLFSYSGSYAFVQSQSHEQLYVNGDDITNASLVININDTCQYVRLEANWSPSQNGYGAVQAFGDILIGEHYYNLGSNNNSYSTLYNTPRYWSTIYFYLGGNYCSGTARLSWG